MSNPFLGEIRLFAGNFAPLGWAMCNGAQLSIADNNALFALLGTTYGGDGITTFQLPDLRGRLPVHMGQGLGLSNYVIGQIAGTETVTITVPTMAAHNHQLAASKNAATTSLPANSVLGVVPKTTGDILYVEASASPALVSLAPQTINMQGGNQPHENMAPFLCLTFIIATSGVFPSRN
ncbi:MAG TPA: tail fiber protein [Caulobacteraceae bacterium]|jgi:microcystin-dependent protein